MLYGSSWAKGVQKEVSPRFADDTVRRMRQSADQEGTWWPAGFRILPWATGFACAAVAGWILIPFEEIGGQQETVLNDSERGWSEMNEVAEVEILIAAADHLDQFSDQELVRIVGF